jgi:signal transduction histidine kinase
MRRRGLGLCLASWTICRVIANVTATAPRSSPGPSPLLLAAPTRGGRAELRVIDRGPGVREAGAAVAILIGKLAELAEAQASSQRVEAALRRVAKLVARGAPPEVVFAAVTEEVGRLLQAGQATMIRYEPDGTATFVAAWSRTGDTVPLGARESLGRNSLITIVWQTGHQARIGSYADASGTAGLVAREVGFRSAVGAPIVVQGCLWGAMIADSVDQQPLGLDTETRLASFTELVATAISNTENLAELTASRARVVAAADETRRRIERDLHDGAQQRLVSLALALRAAQMEVPPQLGRLTEELAEIADGLASLQDDLREMARGIHPAILAQGGLEPALKTLARRCTVPVRLDLRAGARLPERIEVAAYYVVAEALTNAAKHAQASAVHVETEAAEGALQLWVRDDGTGGADPVRGSGLVGLKDRVEALCGTITVHSPPGAGTAVHVKLPLAG